MPVKPLLRSHINNTSMHSGYTVHFLQSVFLSHIIHWINKGYVSNVVNQWVFANIVDKGCFLWGRKLIVECHLY